MWDTHIYQRGTQLVEARVNVNEHRAPTDDSIRLYKEMEEKSKLSLVRTLPLDLNLVKGTLTILEEHHMQRYQVYISFNINGKEIIYKDYLNGIDYYMAGNLTLDEWIITKVSQGVTNELMKHIIAEPEVVGLLKSIRG